jgi:hypothetical protein
MAEIEASKAEAARKLEAKREGLVSGERAALAQADTADKAGAYAASAEGWRKASYYAREQARYALDRGSVPAEQRAQQYDSNALRADALAKQPQRGSFLSVGARGALLRAAGPTLEVRQLGIDQAAPSGGGGALPYVAAAAAAAGLGWFFFLR